MTKLLKERGPAAVLLFCGLGLMALGLWRGELNIYFAKAVRLCLECVGIG